MTGSEHTDGWMLQALQDIRTDMRDQHARMRADMNAGFNGMRDEFRGQNDRLADHSDRLIVLETHRNVEEKQAIRRGTYAGILASAGLTALISIVRAMIGK